MSGHPASGDAVILQFPLNRRRTTEPDEPSLETAPLTDVLAYLDWWLTVTQASLRLAQTSNNAFDAAGENTPDFDRLDHLVEVFVKHLDEKAAQENVLHRGQRPTVWIPVHLWGEVINGYRAGLGECGVDVTTLQHIAAMALASPLTLDGFTDDHRRRAGVRDGDERAFTLVASLIMGPVWDAIDGDVIQFPFSRFENHLPIPGAETDSWTTEELLRGTAAVLVGLSHWAAAFTGGTANETLDRIDWDVTLRAIAAASEAGHEERMSQITEVTGRAVASVAALA